MALALPAVVAALLVCILPLHRRQPPLPQPLRRQYQRPCLCRQIHCQLRLLKNLPLRRRPPPPPRPLRCQYQRPFLCCQIHCQLVQNCETQYIFIDLIFQISIIRIGAECDQYIDICCLIHKKNRKELNTGGKLQLTP